MGLRCCSAMCLPSATWGGGKGLFHSRSPAGLKKSLVKLCQGKFPPSAALSCHQRAGPGRAPWGPGPHSPTAALGQPQLPCGHHSPMAALSVSSAPAGGFLPTVWGWRPTGISEKSCVPGHSPPARSPLHCYGTPQPLLAHPGPHSHGILAEIALPCPCWLCFGSPEGMQSPKMGPPPSTNGDGV